MPDIFISKLSKKKDKQISKKSEKVVKKDVKTIKKERPVYSKNLKTFPHNPLSSFIYCPKDATFSSKDPEEKVILILRKHPITNLGTLIIGVLMVLAPLLLNVFPIIDFLPGNFRFIAVVIWYLVTMAFLFEKFLTWFFNVNIVTDERLFDVDFVHLTYREMTDANIDQIQDVTVKMGSVIRTVFNYGDIVIQTAAEIPQIEFDAIPKPDKVAKILRELRVEEEVEKLEGRVR